MLRITTGHKSAVGKSNNFSKVSPVINTEKLKILLVTDGLLTVPRKVSNITMYHFMSILICTFYRFVKSSSEIKKKY